MTIGERIKMLRKQHDLTQEKLAEYLCVSYQAVSKWECGVANPDLSMIGPLTKLLHISADELLGLTDNNPDNRKAELDALCRNQNLYTLEQQMEIAGAAVQAYPGELEFLYWLANCTYMLAFQIEDETAFRIEREKALRMFCTVFDSTEDEKLRDKANVSIVMALSSLGRHAEAGVYADRYPDTPSPDRNTLIGWTLTGMEKRMHHQEQLRCHIEQVISDLTDLQDADDSNLRDLTSLLWAENLIRLFLPDGNYLHWNDYLFLISIFKAQNYQHTDPAKAINCLQKAKEYAAAFDSLILPDVKKCRFTTPLLNLPEVDMAAYLYDGPPAENSRMDSFFWWLSGKCFDPLRERADFQSLAERK